MPAADHRGDGLGLRDVRPVARADVDDGGVLGDRVQVPLVDVPGAAHVQRRDGDAGPEGTGVRGEDGGPELAHRMVRRGVQVGQDPLAPRLRGEEVACERGAEHAPPVRAGGEAGLGRPGGQGGVRHRDVRVDDHEGAGSHQPVGDGAQRDDPARAVADQQPRRGAGLRRPGAGGVEDGVRIGRRPCGPGAVLTAGVRARVAGQGGRGGEVGCGAEGVGKGLEVGGSAADAVEEADHRARLVRLLPVASRGTDRGSVPANGPVMANRSARASRVTTTVVPSSATRAVIPPSPGTAS